MGDTKAVVKDGWKTVELWATIVATAMLGIWPAFPVEAFLAIITWAAGRSAQKMFGMTDPATGKPSWQTSEFWVAIAYSILVTVFPDLPPDALYAVQGWVAARTGIKLSAPKLKDAPKS